MIKVSAEDVEFLKDEYRIATRTRFESVGRDRLHLAIGTARGLETALIRMGVSNDELDGIVQEEYKKIRGED